MQATWRRRPTREERHMRVCIPVSDYQGLDSPVHGHFGSAPCFAVIDTDTMNVERLSNRDEHHVHGACSPLSALAGHKVDTVLIGGIGRGALLGLKRGGISVHRVTADTVGEAVAYLLAGNVEELDENGTCGGHGEASSCHCQH